MRLCANCEKEHPTHDTWDHDRERCADTSACMKRLSRVLLKRYGNRKPTLTENQTAALYAAAPKLGDK